MVLSNSELFYQLSGRKHIFSIMPINNMASVIEHGILSHNLMPENAVSVADDEVQIKRDSKRVPRGMALHDYANLYFDCKNPMLYRRKDIADEICILAISSQILNCNGVVLADRNAASDYVRFFDPSEIDDTFEFELVYLTDWTSDDQYTYYMQKSKKCAEILVPDCLPYEYITAACVVSDDGKRKLEELGFTKKIVVDTERKWFFY